MTEKEWERQNYWEKEGERERRNWFRKIMTKIKSDWKKEPERKTLQKNEWERREW